ncbi:hypothetical protein Efla_002168 [Eimeria flavescens]
MEGFGAECEGRGVDSVSNSLSAAEHSVHEAPPSGVAPPSCLEVPAGEGPPAAPPGQQQLNQGGPPAPPPEQQDAAGAAAGGGARMQQADLSKPWALPPVEGGGGPGGPPGGRACEQQAGINACMHALGLSAVVSDGTFPQDWLGLAWEYQGMAEHVIRSAWPCCYPEGLLPCVSQQVDYLKRRLEAFPSLTAAEQDRFQRLFILAALGIIAKMKLVTFCWTFVELKQNETRAGGRNMSAFLSHMRQSPLKGPRRLAGMQLHAAAAGGGGGPADAGGGPLPDDIERTEYTTRSGRKTHRTAMKPEKS